VKIGGNVSTWKLVIETRPGRQPDTRASFMTEMRLFLPAATVRDTIEKEPYWTYLTQVVTDLGEQAVAALKSPS
jgi:hypothetical protein